MPADKEQDGEHEAPQVKATPAQRASWVVVHAEITLELHELQIEHAAVPVNDALYMPAAHEVQTTEEEAPDRVP